MPGTKMESLLSRMNNLGTEVVDKHLIAQIYGEAGVGKTILALMLARQVAPEGTNIVYVDSMENFVSVGNFPGLEEGIVRVAFEEWEDLPLLLEMIRKGGIKDVSTIVYDEMSTISDRLLDRLHRDNIGASDDEIPTDAVDPKTYKPMQDSISRLMTEAQKIGLHQILVAHERQDAIRPKVFHTSPGYSPKNRDAILKKVHVSARLLNTITGSEREPLHTRVIQSWPSALVAAKSRIGTLPFQTDPETWLGLVSDWVYSDAPTADEQRPLEVDVMPLDGVPLAQSSDEDDDEPTDN